MEKSIRLYLDLNPNDYPTGQFPHKDVSSIKRHEKDTLYDENRIISFC
ncbi:MAG: hypothetical protein L6U99_00750 [Clostridium sp.]|nr:MAG: hypothetical protein L6U99_00750 [Clostridium sp.]